MTSRYITYYNVNQKRLIDTLYCYNDQIDKQRHSPINNVIVNSCHWKQNVTPLPQLSCRNCNCQQWEELTCLHLINNFLVNKSCLITFISLVSHTVNNSMWDTSKTFGFIILGCFVFKKKKYFVKFTFCDMAGSFYCLCNK